MSDTSGNVYAVLGALLEYPSDDLISVLDDVENFVQESKRLNRRSRANLIRFLGYLRARDLFTLQENYVALFDRGRATSLYLFEHVHGESRDRGQAMVDLLRMYEERGMVLKPGELPDYLPVFLEYLSQLPSASADALLAETAAILETIAKNLTSKGSHYSFVVGPLLEIAGIRSAGMPDRPDDDVENERLDQSGYRELDKAYADAPVRFMGAGDAVEQPIHLYTHKPR